MAMENSAISVVIPVKNSENSIGRCLKVVFSQSISASEVIIVDGHSTDRTVDYASKFPVRIIYENYGTVGGARQVGLENAKGEFVAFTDADCIPEKDWLENLVKGFDEDLAGVGGGIKNVGKGIWEKSIALIMNTFLGSANSVQGRLFKEKQIVKSISGCNSMYRRELLMKIGGFNVTLSVNEDTELNQRLSKIGKLIYIPNAVVVHNQGRGLKDFAKRMFQFGYGRGRLRLWDLQCLPPIVALSLIASLIFTMWIFAGGIVFYIFVLGLMGLKLAVLAKDIRYVASTPLVYAVEHFSYIVGFWKGLFTS